MITREDAASMLAEPGDFLVRLSQGVKYDSYTLDVSENKCFIKTEFIVHLKNSTAAGLKIYYYSIETK